MQHELLIEDLDTKVDPAGSVEISRISIAVVRAVIKAVSDVIISSTNHITN